MALDPRSPFSQMHPLAGKITAGVRTTENRARLPHQSMQLAEMPQITMADRAQQMFSMTDTKGTRVYYSNIGVFNTVDDTGKPISFIQGLFKTSNRQIMRYLQQFVEGGNIHYLELEEDPSDATEIEHQPSDGSISRDASKQLDEPQPERREEATPDPDRSGPGGEDTEDAELPIERTAVSSESGDRDDSSQPSSEDNPVGEGQPAVEAAPLSLSERMKRR